MVGLGFGVCAIRLRQEHYMIAIYHLAVYTYNEAEALPAFSFPRFYSQSNTIYTKQVEKPIPSTIKSPPYAPRIMLRRTTTKKIPNAPKNAVDAMMRMYSSIQSTV